VDTGIADMPAFPASYVAHLLLPWRWPGRARADVAAAGAERDASPGGEPVAFTSRPRA
jgi:hypothetical protein